MNHPEFYKSIYDMSYVHKGKKLIIPAGHLFYRILDGVYTTFNGIYIEDFFNERHFKVAD
ncbi:hypothetical protein [Bergeyella zoohelcum]|uniref:hypothetical protein n=1 Tax=Bergeyella zoohelcum TaxID=1015 RepID=UPI003734E55F